MTTAPVTLRDRYASASTLDAFIEGATHLLDLWRQMRARAHAPEDLLARARALPAPRRLLVLLEDWCGDAVNTIPMLAALADGSAALELRVLARDEHLDLMDAHLTRGSRSIPVVIALDEQGRELGWWGPRPAPLQDWATSEEARGLDPAARYKEIRRRYARDRGRTTLVEVLDLLERDATRAAA